MARISTAGTQSTKKPKRPQPTPSTAPKVTASGPPASHYVMEILPTFEQLEQWISDQKLTLERVLDAVGRSKTRMQFKRLRERTAPEVLLDCYRWLLAQERLRPIATPIGLKYVLLEDWAALGLRMARLDTGLFRVHLDEVRADIERAAKVRDLEEQLAVAKADFERGAM